MLIADGIYYACLSPDEIYICLSFGGEAVRLPVDKLPDLIKDLTRINQSIKDIQNAPTPQKPE